MTTQINYKITKLWASPEPINGFSDVVVNVFFDITATNPETGKTGVYHGVANLDNPAENASGFINYSNLTESQLISWTKEKLGLEATSIMEQQAIQDTLSPAIKTDLPWA